MIRLLVLVLVALVAILGCTAPAAELPQAPPPFALPDRTTGAAEAKAYYATPKGAVRLGALDLRHATAYSVAYTADGKTLLTAGTDGVRAWEVPVAKPEGRATTFQLLRTYSEDASIGGPVAATPDNRHFVTLGEGTAHLRNRADGQSVRSFGTNVACFAVAPDGKTLATGSSHGEVLLWDIATGKCREFSITHPSNLTVTVFDAFGFANTRELYPAITQLAFAPDGKTIASAGLNDVVRGWDTKTGLPQWVFTSGTTVAGPFAFSPDGKRIAIPTYHNNRTAYGYALWNFADGSREVEFEDGGYAGGSYGGNSVAFSPDGRYLAVGAGDTRLRVWNTQTGKLRFTAPMPSPIQELRFAPDGKTLACAGAGITLWDVETGKERVVGAGHVGSLRALAVTADGATAFSIGNEGSVRAWNAKTGEQRWMLPLKSGGDVPYTLALTPDGTELAVGTQLGAVRVYDAASGQELRKMPGVIGYVYGLTYAPDGKTLAAMGFDLIVRLWDARTGNEQAQFVGYDGTDSGGGGPVLRFTPDGKGLVSGVRRGQISPAPPGGKPIVNKFDATAGPGSDDDGLERLVLWDVATGKRLRVLGEPNPRGPTDAAFSADGKLLATNDGTAFAVIDVVTGKQKYRFEAVHGTLAFATDGTLWIGSARYDPTDGKKLSEVAGGKNCVAALSKDGRTLVTADDSATTALVWKLP